MARALSVCLLVNALSGCDAISGLSDFAITGDSAGGHAGGGGQGGSAEGGSAEGGSAGSAGAGGEPLVLVDDGLVARYFLDEAASGPPLAFLDAGPNGRDLAVSPDGNLSYTSDIGRGAQWMDGGSGGVAVRDGVADMLNQAGAATIEAVVEMTGTVDGGRIVHIGPDNNGQLALAHQGNELQLRINNLSSIAAWPFSDASRHVLHVRVDMAQAQEPRRAVLFVDGIAMVSPGSVMALVFDIPPQSPFHIGNRSGADRSVDGSIYYVALYRKALSDDQIAQNAEVLAVKDDAN